MQNKELSSSSLIKLKGCGKEVEWGYYATKYKCGEMEDLKHSDHIILCEDCLKDLEEAKK